jgi:hypothetical protein
MEQSPSWETKRSSATQEISWNPKVHYCVHKSPLSLPILSKTYPVHSPHPTSLRSILIFYSHLRLGPQSYFLEKFDMLQHSAQDAENEVWELLTEFVSEDRKVTDCLNNLEVNKWLILFIQLCSMMLMRNKYLTFAGKMIIWQEQRNYWKETTL